MIALERVCKVFTSGGQEIRAVDDVSIEVGAGELVVLIGPSGSGKTTTMRMINRLETLTSGRIVVNGRDVRALNDVELRRGIGYVIQQGGLFPHFTVADNVAVVPRLLGWSRDKRRQRACELLALVGLPPEQFANRYPRQLSGGQQQRVGVARALAADPPIVLMDEPFGAVDPITRKQLQRELRRIQAEVQKTIVFVTHDIAEAFLLGDRIVLMAAGRVVQDSAPADLLRNPADPFVTSFIGEDRGLRSCSSPLWPSSPLRRRLTCDRTVWFSLARSPFGTPGGNSGSTVKWLGRGSGSATMPGNRPDTSPISSLRWCWARQSAPPGRSPAKGRQMAYLRDNPDRVLELTKQHVQLVAVSILVAMVIGIPLGILVTRLRWLEGPVVGIAGVLYTLPSLALFAILIPYTGLGRTTVIVALILYSLLAIVRNTVTGIDGVPRLRPSTPPAAWG